MGVLVLATNLEGAVLRGVVDDQHLGLPVVENDRGESARARP